MKKKLSEERRKLLGCFMRILAKREEDVSKISKHFKDAEKLLGNYGE
jgi:predicted CopG family antitoxin